MNSNVNETPDKPTQRTVFFVSDATAITAETLANAVLAQFHGLKYLRYRMPFVNTEEKAKAQAKAAAAPAATAPVAARARLTALGYSPSSSIPSRLASTSIFFGPNRSIGTPSRGALSPASRRSCAAMAASLA